MTMKKLLKLLLIVIAVLILLVVVWIVYMNLTPTVKKGYTAGIETGGNIEQKYLQTGKFETENLTVRTEKPMGKYIIYYPADLEIESKAYPVVLMTNGTGHKASKYTAMLEHLASWGFIVIGNQDVASGTGESASLTLQYILDENENETSIFYHKVDTSSIGITGYSQGGAGAINAVTNYENSGFFKTAVLLSPAQEKTAEGNQYPYDITKIDIPVLMFAGTSGFVETEYVLPLESMNTMYDKLDTPKVMARRIGAEHETMLYLTDGYTTAWLMWQLQDDDEAAKAFIGQNAEIMDNKLYQDQRSDLYE